MQTYSLSAISRGFDLDSRSLAHMHARHTHETTCCRCNRYEAATDILLRDPSSGLTLLLHCLHNNLRVCRQQAHRVESRRLLALDPPEFPKIPFRVDEEVGGDHNPDLLGAMKKRNRTKRRTGNGSFQYKL